MCTALGGAVSLTRSRALEGPEGGEDSSPSSEATRAAEVPDMSHVTHSKSCPDLASLQGGPVDFGAP